MIRFINCVKRRPDISIEQFRQFWSSSEFDELIKAVVAMSGAARYKKSATLVIEANHLVQERRGTGEPFDGVLEYWWDKAAHLEGIMDKPEAAGLMQKMLDYQKQFADIPHSSAFFTEAE